MIRRVATPGAWPNRLSSGCDWVRDRQVGKLTVSSAFGHRRIVDIQLQCPNVTTLSIDSGGTEEFYNVVEDSKASAKPTDRHDDTLQAFTHWTHHVSGALLMVQVNPEGVYFRENSPAGYEYLCFEDPVIHCSDVMRFITHMHIDIHTNLGSEGFKLFFASHKCNEVCKKLDLTPILSWAWRGYSCWSIHYPRFTNNLLQLLGLAHMNDSLEHMDHWPTG